MSQLDNDQLNTNQELKEDERENLKARANVLGLDFPANIPTDKLREKVNEAISGSRSDTIRAPANETNADLRSRKRMEALKLIRCRVTCMDSAKKEWNGEIITVSNSVVGTVRKYVPYNSDAPYHLEQIIISALREKKMQVFVNKPGKYGVPNKESKTVNAYSIEILDPLTDAELQKLAQAQLARNSLAED